MTAQTGQVCINVDTSNQIAWHLLSASLFYTMNMDLGALIGSQFHDPPSHPYQYGIVSRTGRANKTLCFIIIMFTYIYIYILYQLHKLDRNRPCEGILHFKTRAYVMFLATY